ncbi:Zinc finger, RING/FYVE/PHD-type [Parasponia andersonii]|uniref:Zinc finger, RING/FYVE/PHD-type n=1 Tax=Parasponia andersonii TaxID=3476 RepID=A0A2P5AMI3_PARAD|nr:Zinc finger, RING/FYVE/PHD-type [Parasponia andersonii]
MSLCCAIAKIPISNTMSFLINLFKSTTMAALTHLGLFNQSQQTHYSGQEEEEEHSSNYLLLITGPSLPTLSKHTSKKPSPIIDQDSSLCHCPICLDRLALGYHVFHIECLDDWVDEDHFTCPLCRSILFQNKDEKAIFKAIHELG